MTRRTSKISIYTYTDYRKYLSDFYREQKKESKAFSYRYFARKAGINSVGLYKDVVEGRQNLGRSLIFKFSTAIGHTKKEEEYFENMVFFNEATSVEERTLFFDRMMGCQSSKARIVDVTKYEYYHRWYYSAVRALLPMGKFTDGENDCKKIAAILNPRIRPEEAKKALSVLERLGFVSRNPDGIFGLTEAVISTGTLKPEASVTALNVVNYQKEMMTLANESLDRFGAENISLSTLTLGISAPAMNAIKEELAAVRNKIVSLAEKETGADRVYQLNMQFFPMSDTCQERPDA